MPATCDRCDKGWICEEHLDLPWPHGDCAGPGMPCLNAECPWWKSAPGIKPLALTPELFLDDVIARVDDDDEPRQ